VTGARSPEPGKSIDGQFVRRIIGLRMILSDLPTPAEALVHKVGSCQGFAQAGNRFTLFGIMR
jgi:hypothetical protein